MLAYFRVHCSRALGISPSHPCHQPTDAAVLCRPPFPFGHHHPHVQTMKTNLTAAGTGECVVVKAQLQNVANHYPSTTTLTGVKDKLNDLKSGSGPQYYTANGQDPGLVRAGGGGGSERACDLVLATHTFCSFRALRIPPACPTCCTPTCIPHPLLLLFVCMLLLLFVCCCCLCVCVCWNRPTATSW